MNDKSAKLFFTMRHGDRLVFFLYFVCEFWERLFGYRLLYRRPLLRLKPPLKWIVSWQAVRSIPNRSIYLVRTWPILYNVVVSVQLPIRSYIKRCVFFALKFSCRTLPQPRVRLRGRTSFSVCWHGGTVPERRTLDCPWRPPRRWRNWTSSSAHSLRPNIILFIPRLHDQANVKQTSSTCTQCRLTRARRVL